MFFKLFLL